MTTEPKKTASKNLLIDNRWSIITVSFTVIIYLLMPVLTPFLIAAILAYIFNPLVDRLCLVRIGNLMLGRTFATVIVLAGIFCILTLLLLILIPLLQKESLLIAERLPSAINNIRATIEPWLQSKFGINFAIDGNQIQDIITKNWKTAGGVLGDLLIMTGNNSMALLEIFANTLLLPVVLFYLLRDWNRIVSSIGQLVPREWHDKTATIANEIDQVIAAFMRGQLLVMLAMSAFYSIGLYFTGLAMALPIGLIAGLLGFVPYLGIATGVILALVAAVLQFTSFSQLIPILLVFGLGQLLEGMLLTPILVGDRIGLHPVTVIFALLAGGQLFGFAGVLLALPVSAAIAVALRHIKANYLNSDTYLN